jgi:hypothetical protein
MPKKSFLTAIAIVSFVSAAAYAYAAVTSTASSPIQHASIQKAYAARIRQYADLAAHMPSSISPDDQELLSGEIAALIPHMKDALAAITKAGDSRSLEAALNQTGTTTSSDRLTQLKLGLILEIFRPLQLHSLNASSTHVIQGISAHTASSSSDQGKRTASSTRPFLNQFAPNATTTIAFVENKGASPDLVHQLIVVDSIKDLVPLMNEVRSLLLPIKGSRSN